MLYGVSAGAAYDGAVEEAEDDKDGQRKMMPMRMLPCVILVKGVVLRFAHVELCLADVRIRLAMLRASHRNLRAHHRSF